MGELLTRITIDGVNVTDKMINYEVIDTVNDKPTTANIHFLPTISSDLTVTSDMLVIITRGLTTSTDETIFRGFVSEFKKDGTTYRMDAFDKLWILSRRTASTTYNRTIDAQAGVISAIAEDIIETHGGLTATVIASGAILVLDKFILRNNYLLERLEILKDTLGWQLYYSSQDDTVHFEPYGTSVFTTTLSLETNIGEIPEWTYDYSQMANSVKLVGAISEVETTESGQIGVTAGYTQTAIQLDHKPVSVKVFANAINPPTTLRDGGIPDSTPDADFDYSVDNEIDQVIWNTSNYTPGAADFVETRYSYYEPITVRGQNNPSIDAYGLYEKVEHFDTFVTVDDAEKRMNMILSTYANPFVNTTIRVFGVMGMRAGMTVTVIDTINTENRSLVIREITYRYPDSFDELIVGDEPMASGLPENDARKRIEELERKFAGDQELVREVREFDLMTVQSKSRYLEVLNGTNNPAAFILDHITQGILGTSTLGDLSPTYASQRFIWPNLLYEETFFDTDFRNAGATTATWTPPLTFAATQVARSSTFWDNAQTPVSVTLTATFTGTITWEVSGNDGTTFETVSGGLTTGVAKTHTFTVADTTGIQWRATESGAAAATVTRLNIQVTT
ncbi:hypothetical protein A2415_04510 [candidate division WWE3 bacterium RIFOXYC1_FULL_39_7]|uniref:Uncharacterized protein n=1 Tax=candidate division WWE3 bacterium RIFOXYC1_FULL_39_7 TaxID=1802643 RepID=A0A1F4WFU2_UNCKA|nr:MAG: hypothetical protein A2415_04510 [candidate division WWE3 bacterium RIFOXYC1_FULL_39_7]